MVKSADTDPAAQPTRRFAPADGYHRSESNQIGPERGDLSK